MILRAGTAIFSLNLSCCWNCRHAFCHDGHGHVCGHAYDACAFCDVLEAGNQVAVVDRLQVLQGAFQVYHVVDDVQNDVQDDVQDDVHEVEDVGHRNQGLGMAACLAQGMVQGMTQEDHKAVEGKAAVVASHQAFLS